VPTLVAAGVPESLPVAVLKVAHDGLFWMLKAAVLPVLVSVGVKAYAEPATTAVDGDPDSASVVVVVAVVVVHVRVRRELFAAAAVNEAATSDRAASKVSRGRAFMTP
jgi:hypothetical protein